VRRRDKWLITLAVLVIALVALRLALPSIVKDYANGKLQALEAYDGSVQDIDLHLWRGAYRIVGLTIEKTGAKQPVPFFSSTAIDVSVEWKSLMRGALVAEAEFLDPDLNLIQAKNEKDSQLGKEENWTRRFEDLFPFRFNSVRVRDGRVTFTAPGVSTKDALTAEHVQGELVNLTNVEHRNKETFADFVATARVLGEAPLEVKGSVNPWARQPTFDVNLQVRGVELPKANPWLREYIKADAESGELELYLELAAADGKFQGYAKPVLRDVNILSSEEPEKNPLKRIWEGLVDFAANVLENPEEEHVAARIPFSGTIKEPQTSVLATIVSVLRNAFVSAFARSLEGSVSLRDVKKNLGKIGDDTKPGDRPSD
jgi:uncharacterized protein involved in outer membrane biogenesis